MGKGEYRVQAAEALLASMKSSAASSPETVEKILQASGAFHSPMSWKRQRLPACSGSEQGPEFCLCSNRQPGVVSSNWLTRAERDMWLPDMVFAAVVVVTLLSCGLE